MTLQSVLPISIVRVERKEQHELWKRCVSSFHYLGYRKTIGRRLKYIVYSNDSAALSFLEWKTGSLNIYARDCFIGWNTDQKARYLNHTINNSRFLLLPRIPNLASFILSRSVKIVCADWKKQYGNDVFLCETFINPKKYSGTCYKAANWTYVGNTKGFERTRTGYTHHGIQKEIYVYVTLPHFRTIIGCTQIIPHKSHTKKLWEEKHIMMIQTMDYNPELIDFSDFTEAFCEELADELLSFHSIFAPAFRRSEQRLYFQTYIKGLCSDIDRKNIEAIALRYLGPDSVRGLQKFMGASPWDDEYVAQRTKEMLSEALNQRNGMLTIDASEIAKKGTESVGVARQYCGTIGKVENCQSGVFAGYTSEAGYGLHDARLYLPQKWFTEEYGERRIRCGIPEGVSFKTKNEIALDLISNHIENGPFLFQWIGVDAGFGSDSKFRDTVDTMGKYYFAAIRSNQLTWTEKPDVVLFEYSGKGRRPKEGKLVPAVPPQSVKNIAASKELDWQLSVIAEGAKGPVFAHISRVRVFECNDEGLPGKELWLYLRKEMDGKIRYYISNAPIDTSIDELNRVATMRWPIEQSFEDGKKYLGMDHYEHRSWKAWHRHMMFIMVTMLFILQMRMKYKKNPNEYLTSN